MPALNRVQLIGRLGKNPESRFTPTGKKMIPAKVIQYVGVKFELARGI